MGCMFNWSITLRFIYCMAEPASGASTSYMVFKTWKWYTCILLSFFDVMRPLYTNTRKWQAPNNACLFYQFMYNGPTLENHKGTRSPNPGRRRWNWTSACLFERSMINWWLRNNIEKAQNNACLFVRLWYNGRMPPLRNAFVVESDSHYQLKKCLPFWVVVI